jgi:hypothetical protein
MSTATVLLNNILYDPDISEITKQWPNTSTVVVKLLFETVEPYLWESQFYKLLEWRKQHYPNQRVFVVLNSWYRDYSWSQYNALVQGWYFVNYFLVKVWLEEIYFKNNGTDKRWNSSSQQFLFLTGKPCKINRIRLLWLLFNSGALKHARWSFFSDYPNMNTCREYLDNLNDQQYQTFLKNFKKTLDIDCYNKTHYNSYNYNKTLYQDSLFAIVSETYFDRLYVHPWVTEKTWIHIANKLPFIMAGEHKTNQLLENMGFDNFTNYMAVQNFDNPDVENYLQPTYFKLEHAMNNYSWRDFYNSYRDPLWPDSKNLDVLQHQNILSEALTHWKEPIAYDGERRLNAIVTNTLFWLSTTEWKQSAAQAVEHNYCRFVELGLQKFNHLSCWLADNNVELDPVEIFTIP